MEKTVEETVEETVEKILNTIKENPKVTVRELQEITGLSRKGVEYNIDKLKKNNRIKRMGPDKGGIWKVNP